VEDITIGFADCSEPILAIVAALVFPDQHRAGEDSRAVVETEAALPQVPGMSHRIPLELLMGTLRMKRTPAQIFRRGSSPQNPLLSQIGNHPPRAVLPSIS
jgi:hypothetical protein